MNRRKIEQRGKEMRRVRHDLNYRLMATIDIEEKEKMFDALRVQRKIRIECIFL